MTIKERYDFVKKHRLCFACLHKNHSAKKCSDAGSCGINNCEKVHHQLLHYNARTEPITKQTEAVPSTSTARKETLGVMAQNPISLGNVLLQIVPVELQGPKKKMIVNAFLDTGGTVAMIDAQVATTLGLEGWGFPLHLEWQGKMQDSDEHSKIVSLTIRGMEEKEEFHLQNIRTKKGLLLPVQPMSDYKLLKKWTHLQNVPFPKVLPGRPVIVIGEEHARLIVGRKLVEGPGNAQLASWTRLGWVAHGPNGKRSAIRKSIAMCAVETVDPDAALHELVKQQFRLDSLGVVNCEKLPQSKVNHRAEQIMEETSRRVGDGWETGMLWKLDEPMLPESWSAAMHRLRILERKMDKDANYADLYCGKIEEYVNKGFCRKLSTEEIPVDDGREWYLPHFGTTNPNKPGKLRLVFDCAAKVNGMCLNDALLQGPDLMSPLISVLLKFRQWEVAFSGDIRDMFHMVKIVNEDAQALRFLWRGKDQNRIPDIYQMSVMVFGAVSSPFQAQWVKKRNAHEYAEEAPDAVDAICNRHYVDDYLDSCKTSKEAIQKIIKVREIHRRGGFEIRGWLSKDSDVLKVVAPEEQVEVDTLHLNMEDKVERVLGLFWEPKRDTFKFKTSFHKVDKKYLMEENYLPNENF